MSAATTPQVGLCRTAELGALRGLLAMRQFGIIEPSGNDKAWWVADGTRFLTPVGSARFLSHHWIIDEGIVAIHEDRRNLDERGASGSMVDDLEYGVQHALDVLPHHLDLVAE